MSIDVAPVPVTAEQEAHAQLVQDDLVEYFRRQIAEGMDWRVLLVGAGAAIAAMVLNIAGGKHVPTWFAQMAARTWHLAQPAPHQARDQTTR
jgi:hypothetical protein